MGKRANGEGTVRQRKARKRANGDGTVTSPTTGLWEGRYIAADGRQRSIYAKTQAEALRRLRTAQGEAEAGIRPTPQRLTVGVWLDEWLAASVRPRLRPATVASYEMIVKTYLKPSLGMVPLTRLSADRIGAMLAPLLARGDLSPTTVRYVYAVLRIALGRALKAGKVSRNVATMVDPPAKATHELRPLTGDEVGVLIDSLAGDRFAPLFIAALGTGLRQGELLALRWSDVDLDAGMLTVRWTLDRRTRLPAEPKTERARRTIALPASVAAVLRDHRRTQLENRLAVGAAWGDPELVFTTHAGRALDSRNVTHAYQASLARAGLPRQRFHDTRHAWATLQIEAGEDLSVVSRLLGHADLSTTADVYAHLTRGMQGRAAERMDGILTRRRSSTG